MTSPYRIVLDRWLATACPPLGPGQLGLDVGGGTVRGQWRPEPRAHWTVLDVQAGPGVDIVGDITQTQTALFYAFDVVKMTDVLHLVPAPLVIHAYRSAACCVKPGGRLIYTRSYLRPGYYDADRAGVPDEALNRHITPLGDLTTLLAQLVWERFRLTRPLIGAFMRRYRSRPINPNYPPYCLAWGVVETR